MPGRPHHSEKMRSCVDKLLAKGEDESSAYAICTKSLQDAGTPIFEAAEEIRYLSFIGATGAIRTAALEGRDHVVVPVVALVEGVIHAVNSPQAEFVKADRFARGTTAWNERPAYAGHPMINGVPVSGLDVTILEKRVGRVFNARSDGKRLLMEAWLDPERCKSGDQARLLERVRAGKPIEVSVGAFVTLENTEGVHEGKPYKAVWQTITPDHLALLSDTQVGACSIAMGCGALRTNLVTAEGFTELEGEEAISRALTPFPPSAMFFGNQHTQAHGGVTHEIVGKAHHYKGPGGHFVVESKGDGKGHTVTDQSNGGATSTHSTAADAHNFARVKAGTKAIKRVASGFFNKMLAALRTAMPKGWSDVEVKKELQEALAEKEPALTLNGGITAVYDDHVIYCLWPMANSPGSGPIGSEPTYYSRDYTYDAATKEFIVADTRTEVEPVTSYEPTDLEGHSVPASELVQDEPKLKAACGCGGNDNQTSEDNMERKDRIAALAANAHSPVKSLKMLEAASDDELTHLEKLAKAAKDAIDEGNKTAADLKAAQDKITKDAADLKAAQDKITTLEAPKTEEEFLKGAPQSIRDLVADKKATDAVEHASLVGQLKDATAGAFTEEELKAKAIPELRKLATALKVGQVPAAQDFSGRAIPRAATSTDSIEAYAPPDPYAESLKAMQAKTTH